MYSQIVGLPVSSRRATVHLNNGYYSMNVFDTNFTLIQKSGLASDIISDSLD